MSNDFMTQYDNIRKLIESQIFRDGDRREWRTEDLVGLLEPLYPQRINPAMGIPIGWTFEIPEDARIIFYNVLWDLLREGLLIPVPFIDRNRYGAITFDRFFVTPKCVQRHQGNRP